MELKIPGLPWKKIIDDIDDNLPHIPSPFINHDTVCMHELFNKQMVESGQCKTLEQAASTPRYLVCTCSRCRPNYL